MRERARRDSEALRNARLLENKARLESLSVRNKVSQLREASAQTKKPRPYHKRVNGLTPLRRSQRIKAVTTTATVAAAATNRLQPRRSLRLESSSTQPVTPKLEKVTTYKGEEEEKRPANTPLEEEKKRPANAPLIELNDEEFRRREERRKRGSEMGNVRLRERTKCDYEALRNARLLENKARLESLGVLNKVSQLREASAQTKTARPYHKRVYGLTPLRRSQRIKAFTTTPAATPAATTTTADHFQPPRSQRLKSSSTQPVTPKQEKVTTNKGEEEKKRPANTPLEEEKRPANAPLIELDDVDFLISAESSARRCDSKGRGTVYNGVLGICCHFCRQKKLCGEEDCKRCGNCDVDEPCLGKTDCSVCHSSTGVFCRACLKVRYGEEIEEVRENKGWMCPHCIEEKGINPYWICNSSICLRKRNMSPTGLAIYKAREMGYESVAHLLMEELKCGKR